MRGTTIVFVNNFPGPHLGGGEAHLLALVEGCVAEGMSVHAICVAGSGIARAAARAGAAVVEERFSPPDAIGSVRRIRAYCAGHSAAILHTTGYYTNLLGRLAERAGGPAIVNSVHTEPDSPRRAGGSALTQVLRDLADRATCARADLVLAISQAVFDGLVSLGYDRSRLRVIHNGVNADAVVRSAEAPYEMPAALAGGPAVGTVGRLERVKDLGTFLRAAALTAARRPDVRFVIAGEGPEREKLESLAGQLGIADKVVFLGWVSPVAPVLARLDLVALSSRSEGLPTVLLEAMALGKPVVATAVGGAPEIVEDGRTGALVPAGDSAAFAEAILGLLALDDLSSEAMSGAARARVREGFSLETMLAAHLAEYRRLLG